MKENEARPERPHASLARQKPAAENGQTAATDPPLPGVPLPIVGVGASAGGLEAFAQLLSQLPPDTGMAFVLIQHLDPTHMSLLAEALARATKMPVCQAEDGALIEADHVYVIPPNADIAVRHGRLSLFSRNDKPRKLHLPVDFFFQSLAADRGSHAIGVVLSGTASDGTEGLKAIKAEDGITFAQDPSSAKFGGMPHSAIAAGVVDYSLSIPALARELVRLSRHPYVAGQRSYPPPQEARRLSRLEHELSATKEYLETLIEDHDRANDDLNSANEELVSGNEELQSMNEELETAKEELQSINEELTTVNDELHSRNRELNEVNSDLINLLGTVDVPTLILDMDGRIRRFTPKARSILNVLPSDVGRALHDIRVNIAVADLGERIRAVMETGTMHESEVQGHDGRWYRMQIRPYKTTDNRINGATLSLVDIDVLKQHLTEARQAKAEAERSNRAKDQFLAILSHELRTPLSTMLMQSQMLRMEGMTPEAQRAGASIERATRTQVQLIDDLLDVSRIVTGKLKLESQVVDLCSVVRSALDAVGPMATRKSITLGSVLDEPIGMLLGDAARLQQVVSNVLTNAIKFTPKGGQVTLSLAAVDGHAHLTVSDTGMGIAAAFLPHIFNRFSQEDGSSTRAHGGLGLGLAIVHHLVEAHGGTVKAESPGPGKGATISVVLPLMPVDPAERDGLLSFPRAIAPQTGFKVAIDSALLQGLRVLVVDDDPGTREAVATMLRQTGADVRMAESTALAMAAVDEHWPEVLLCDVAMPGEDGYSFIRRLRARSPTLGGDIPALALTALAGEDDRLQALAAGFQMHVAKPTDIDHLMLAVAELSQRATPAEAR